MRRRAHRPNRGVLRGAGGVRAKGEVPHRYYAAIRAHVSSFQTLNAMTREAR